MTDDIDRANLVIRKDSSYTEDIIAGGGEAWYRVRLGAERSQVRILSARLQMPRETLGFLRLFLVCDAGVISKRQGFVLCIERYTFLQTVASFLMNSHVQNVP